METLTIPTMELGYDYDILLESWHNKLQGFYQFGTERIPLTGGLGIGFELLAQYDQQGWLNSIPSYLLHATKDYPEYQYQMLWLVANCGAAKQLLSARPILLALICEHASVDNERALELCLMGQKEVLIEIGLDGTKAALKFLDKLDLDYSKGDELERVKYMLRPIRQRYLRLRHYTRIDYITLRFDQVFPFLSGSRLGLAMINQGRVEQYGRLSAFQDALDLGRALGINDPIRVIANQQSLETFHELHDRWARRYNRTRTTDNYQCNIDKDEPYDLPLKGNAQIEPITCYRELLEEGSEMLHCIAIYHHRIKAGQYYAFRMLTPQRVTIGVQRTNAKHFPFAIDQISGKRNAQASEETLGLVLQWLETCKLAYNH
ncbi:PcfJ domain-containing protein [Vibrio alfacsensis]|uniref:PcfJ domain-containing protein n=1 Tax=Vibrio alfacsensis TaxID=1074311 RepID=UPI00406959C9